MKQPIKYIPEELFSRFSMSGLVSIEYKYRDDSTSDIQDDILSKFTQESFNKFYNKIKRRQSNYYGRTDKWLYQALDMFGLTGKRVCVFGSACPWYETIALMYGASLCDVLEYSPRPSFDERIRYCSKGDMGTYDAALSISSFEHYGLGRYGDPINPDGDIEAMREAREMLTDDGLLFFSVPMGVDKVYFNVHRVYGKHRFPELIEGFEVIESFGVGPNSHTRTDNVASGTPYQPVFILKKK